MKLNTITGTVCMAALLFVSAFTAAAQSKKMPIDSLGSAVSYDLLHVQNVMGQISANSMVNTNGSQTFWQQSYNPNGVPKVGDLMTIVATNSFAFLIARPTNDPVFVYLSYNDVNGEQLFYSDEGFMLTKSNGVWQVPASATTNVQTWIGFYEPIYEKGAIGAQLNLRDSNGNVLQSIGLQVNYNSSTGIGTILNQTQYLGQHGELVVSYGEFDQNGNATNSYQVAFANDEDQGGVALVPSQVKASIATSWSGLITNIAPPYASLTNVPSSNHVGSSEIVEMTLTNYTSVYFSASTTEGENANGFTVKLLAPGQDLPKVPYTIPSGSAGVWEQLPPGTYHIDYTWPQLAPAQIYPYWYYGDMTTTVVDGKG